MNATITENDLLPQLPLDVWGVIFSFLEANPSYSLVSKEIAIEAEERVWHEITIRNKNDGIRLLQENIRCISCLRIHPDIETYKVVLEILRTRRRFLRVQKLIFEDPRFSIEREDEIYTSIQYCIEIGALIRSLISVDLGLRYEERVEEKALLPIAENRFSAETLCVDFMEGNGCFDSLFKAMETNTTIKHLRVEMEWDSPGDVPFTEGTLRAFLESNTSVQHLHLKGSPVVSDKNGIDWEALYRNTSITSLTIEGEISWEKKGYDYFLNGLRGNTSIQHLSISQGGLGGNKAKDLAFSLMENGKLRSLSLHDPLIYVQQCHDILEVFKDSTCLKCLDLSGSSCFFKGMHMDPHPDMWKRFLRLNTSLTELRLNKIGSFRKDNFTDLLAAISMNTSLQHVYGPDNLGSYASEEADYLIDVLSSSLSLRTFHIGQMPPGESLSRISSLPTRETGTMICNSCLPFSSPVLICYDAPDLCTNE